MTATVERAAVRTMSVTIDGHQVTVPEGTTIFDAAREVGVDIPVLCHNERYDPVGVCRMCVVDTGGRVFAAACVRPCEDGMEVTTASQELDRSRATLAELLMADQPPRAEDPKDTTTRDNLLLDLADGFGVARETTELPCGSGRGTDSSNPVIDVDHDACILCDRCVRACDDIQGNDVIGRSGKGYSTRIAFDLDDPMGASSCVTCGECVQACPTGALTNKPIRGIPIRPREELEAVDSVCPYCGVGCALTYYVDRERGAISFAEGRDQPGSQSRLCVKGRYGWDYSASPQRLTVPLIRIDSSYPKGPLSADVRGDGRGGTYNDRGRGDAGGNRSGGGRAENRRDGRPGKDRGRKPGGLVDYDEVLPHFREATWEEALDLVARRLREIHTAGGPAAIAGLRLGQVLQRGGLPLPEADPHRLRHEQRRPLHPALPRLLGVRAVRGRRLRCGVHHLRRRGQRRRRDHHRLQPDGQPPGGQLVLQAGPPPRHQGRLRRPAGVHGGRARRHLRAAQAGYGRGVLQRGDARDHPARAGRPGVHREPHVELRRAGPHRRRLPAGAGRADHRRGRRHHPRGRPDLGRGRRRGRLLGDGDLPAHHRHRQRPMPDRAVLDHRQRRAPGHRAASAARAEQRAGRLGRRAGPDVLPGLPGRGRREDPAAVRGGLGYAPSTRSAG